MKTIRMFFRRSIDMPSSTRCCAFFSAFFWLLFPAGACPQASSSSGQPSQPDVYQSQTTLKASTRLVVVDVVATDSKGQPVSDLKAEDFIMLEDGKTQKLSNFSFQHPGTAPALVRPQLHANVVTNAPQYQSSSLNVILFDSINGELISQAYAEDQLAKFFAATELDRPVAIFALESRLKLLHDFPTDAGALKAAVEKYRPAVQAANTESVESRASAFTTKGDYHTNARDIETTLTQLNVLSKILGGYPGRKNLIWLSESFPLDLFPEEVLPAGAKVGDGGAGRGGATVKSDADTFSVMVRQGAFTDYAALVKKMADAMMNAQVAVYPVDAAGVGRNDHLASQHTMKDVAARTGGKVYLNTNDLTMSVRAGLDDGSTYYTLEY